MSLASYQKSDWERTLRLSRNGAIELLIGSKAQHIYQGKVSQKNNTRAAGCGGRMSIATSLHDRSGP